MADDTPTVPSLPLEASKRIVALLPDDGTDLRLVRALRETHGVTRVQSVSARAVGTLRGAKKKGGGLPEPQLARLVSAIVPASGADAAFDFVCQAADVGRPGGGMVLLERLSAATPYTLPPDVPDEAG